MGRAGEEVKKITNDVWHKRARIRIWTVFGILALSLSGACDGKRASRVSKREPGPKVERAVPQKTLAKSTAGKRKRRRPLPPLAPHRGVALAGVAEDLRPCTELVNKICALLSEGAEECGEVRRRLQGRPESMEPGACVRALDWYATHVDEARRPRPCKLLAVAKCDRWGKASNACVNARADVKHLRGTLAHACRAELLVFKGLP